VIKAKPPEVAERLAALCREVDSEGLFSGCEYVRPAFINFRFSDAYLAGGLSFVYSEGRSFGRLEDGGGKKVMVEFVSANPTGPLHVGPREGGGRRRRRGLDPGCLRIRTPGGNFTSTTPVRRSETSVSPSRSASRKSSGDRSSSPRTVTTANT